MPQSFAQLYAHLIFSTKNRRPFLDDEIRPRVHGYLATVIRNLDSLLVVAGWPPFDSPLPIQLRGNAFAVGRLTIGLSRRG